MRGVNSIYLGWGNPRAAISIIGHDVVVLTDGDKSAVLQGDTATRFRTDTSALTNHICGVKKSRDIARFLSSVPSDPHKVTAYDAIFDRYFS